MSKEKQIEEMAKIIQYGELARNRGDLDCSEFTTDIVIKVGLQRLAGAKALYNAGYRKASEVAREIFEEIENAIDQTIQVYNTIAVNTFDSIEQAKASVSKEAFQAICNYFFELKKKYESEKDNEL